MENVTHGSSGQAIYTQKIIEMSQPPVNSSLIITRWNKTRTKYHILLSITIWTMTN